MKKLLLAIPLLLLLAPASAQAAPNAQPQDPLFSTSSSAATYPPCENVLRSWCGESGSGYTICISRAGNEEWLVCYGGWWVWA
jgi:hypothetical protein